MKKLIAITALIVAMTTAVSVTAFAAETTQTVQKVQKTIQVNGKGVVTAKPDTATIFFTVETKGKTVEQTQKENAETTQNVTKALKALGVRDENITTQHYSINEDEIYNEEKRIWEPNGYRAYNRFSIKTNDVNNVGKYIDAATKSGVTNVGSISFSISDPNQYYKQALQAAVKNASSSAATLAQSVGATLGECVSIVEEPSYNSYEMEDSATYDAGMNMKAMAVEEVARNASGADIKYNDIKITAGVNITYAY